MADLSWFPLAPVKFRLRTAGLSPLAATAYRALIDHAWEATARGAAPCTLPDVDGWLANMSGLGAALWATVAAEVRTLYATTDDGLLLDPWMLATWGEQQEKHATAVVRARAGGVAKAANERARKDAVTTPQESPKSASSMLEADFKHAELEGAVPGPKGPRVLAPAPECALAPVGAALPVATNGKPPRAAPTGNPHALENLSDLFAAPPRPTPVALSREESVAESQRQAEARVRRVAITKHYWEQFGAKYDAWAQANERHATRLEDAVRSQLLIRVGEKLHPQQAKELRHEILRQWRESAQSPWIPDLETYIAEQEEKFAAAPQRNAVQQHATL